MRLNTRGFKYKEDVKQTSELFFQQVGDTGARSHCALKVHVLKIKLKKQTRHRAAGIGLVR